MQRYFANEKQENKFILKDDDYYHIKVVMRLKPTEKVEVVYLKKVYLCEINSDYEIIIIKEIESNDLKLETTLILPLLKEQKMDLILQKSTELGIYKIIFYDAKRSIIKFEVATKKLERWSKICKEAAEQSKRNTIPFLEILSNLNDLKNVDGLKLICSTIEKNNNLKKVLQDNKNCVKINMIVGPEGGFEPKEEEFIKNNGFIPISLGKTIMRVETVPIFLLSVLNYEFME